MRKKLTALLLTGSMLTGALTVPAWGSAPADKDELIITGSVSSPSDRDELMTNENADGKTDEKTTSGTKKKAIEVTAADGTRHKLTEVTTDLYITLPEELYSMELYFADGVMDLPYVNLEDFAQLLCLIYNDYALDEGYKLSFEADQDLAALTRENGYTALFDYSECSIRFDDFDAFIIGTGDRFLVDLLSETDVSETSDSVYERLAVGDFDRYGSELLLPLGEYGINLYRDEKNGVCYAPVQTLTDFFLSPAMGLSLRYNGEAAFLVFPGSIGSRYEGYTELGEMYHAQKEVTERSEDLAAYSYAELCLALDHLYGLKEIHQIDDFDTLFINTGLKDFLLSTDPVEADEALNVLIEYYLDDLHSAFLDPSCLCGDEDLQEETGLSYLLNEDAGSLFTDARAEAFGDDVPMYEEIGNTAYITFDYFDAGHSSAELYELYGEDGNGSGSQDDEEVSDIRKLIIEAHQAIYREDSPIENVVLDLSCNSGGAVDAAVFVLSWFLGDAPLTVQDTLTNSISSSIYRADIDMNHEFDGSDSLGDKRLFCIISPYSFSCANLLPAVFKESHQVTLIGQRTGGGSCIVLPLSTAYGTQFRVSGCYRMSTLKNGSVYDVDLGVEPDVYISRPEHLYDREYLTDYINQLP